jgi:hypothetical protein
MSAGDGLGLPGLVRTDAEIRIDMLKMLHEIPPGDNRFDDAEFCPGEGRIGSFVSDRIGG